MGNSAENILEITIEEIQELDKDSYQMVDIRDEVEISHGAIPGAMAVSADSLMPEHLAETAGELFPAEEYISGDNLKGKKLVTVPPATGSVFLSLTSNPENRK